MTPFEWRITRNLISLIEPENALDISLSVSRCVSDSYHKQQCNRKNKYQQTMTKDEIPNGFCTWKNITHLAVKMEIPYLFSIQLSECVFFCCLSRVEIVVINYKDFHLQCEVGGDTKTITCDDSHFESLILINVPKCTYT